MKLTKANLAEFITRTDELGGPGTPACLEYWQDVLYDPETDLSAVMDPLSPAYMDQQMALYRELTGHDYSDARDEFTGGIPIERLLNAPNAYDLEDALQYASHCVAMGLLVRRLGLPRGARILELGSGWGFTQEFLAQCGYETAGVEINQDFVATSNARLERLGFGTRVQMGSFEDFDVSEIGQFDAVISYEAFHHAVDTLAMLRKYTALLKPGGAFALIAEPFNHYYPTWGLRRDPYSIYSIAKFGWFESGWSADYMTYLYGLVGLNAEFHDLPINELTRFMIGRKSNHILPKQLGMWDPEVSQSWWHGDIFFSSRGESRFKLSPPAGVTGGILHTENFSPRAIKIEIDLDGKQTEFSIPAGSKYAVPLEIAGPAINADFKLRSELFCPATEGLNDDGRSLGIHISSVEWLRASA